MKHPKTEDWPFGTKTLPGPAPSSLRTAMIAASAAARHQHESVPVAQATTPYLTLVANPDGTYSARQDIQPQRVRQGGGWVPIDTTLARAADGSVRPAATVVRTAFSGGGTGPAAVEDDGAGHTLTLRWPAPLPAPQLSGPVATYPDVYPGVDLQLVAQPTGLRTLFVVHTAEAAANPAINTLALGLSATGLTVSTTADGGVQAVDRTGHPVFAGTTPLMWDSAGTAQDRSSTSSPAGSPDRAGHRATITARVHGTTVEVSPDRRLLDSASTVYPVVIDPTFTEQASDWIEMWSDGTTVEHGSWSPWPGYDTRAVRVGNSGGTLVRSLLSFDASWLPRPGIPGNEALYVVQANLNLKRQPTTSGACVNTDVWRANPFNSNSNWGNQNGGTNTNLWPTGGTSPDGTKWANPIGHSIPCSSNPDWSPIDITQQVRDVYISGGTTYTLGLRATNEGPSSGNYGSYNVQNGAGGNSYVSVTFVAEPILGAITAGNAIVGNHGTQQNPCGPDANHSGYLPMQTGSIPISVPIDELATPSGAKDTGRWVQYWMHLQDLAGAGQTTSVVPVQAPSTARALLAKATSSADPYGNPTGTTLYLQDGHTYELYAQAMDDVNLTNGGTFINPYGQQLNNTWSDFYNNRYGTTGNTNVPTSVNTCYFVAAMSAPQQVTFTHSDFPASGQHLPSYPTVGTTGKIGVSSTAVTPIVRFDYAINTDSTNEGANHCPTTSPADACGTVTVTPGSSAAADIQIPSDATRWGNNHLYVSAVDAAGNVSQYANYDFFMSQAFQKVGYGDVTGDGVPDVMAVDNAGNLVTYPTNLDPAPGANNATRAAPAASAPNNTSWATSLYTHRGALRVQPIDDLFGWGKDTNGTGHLYYYSNAQQLGAVTLTDAFTTRSEIGRPACSPAATNGFCAGYDQSPNWNHVTQMAAIGPVLGGCNIAAPTVACKTNLITVETDPRGGPSRMWMFSPAGVGRLANPILLSVSTASWHWETTQLLAPGNAAGHPGGAGGMPDLWTRDINGTLWQFTNTSTPTSFGAGLGDLSAKTQLGQTGEFRSQKWIATAGDLNGDGNPDLWTMSADGQIGVVFSPFGTASGNALATQSQTTATALNWATASGVGTVQGAAPTAGLAGQLVLDQPTAGNPSRQMCLDDLNGNTTNSTTVIDVYDCNGTWPQQWYFAPDGTIRLMGQNPAAPPNKCLDTGGSLLLGAKITLFDCQANIYQTWRALPSPSTPGRFSLYNPASGLCVDDTGYGTNNTNPFQLWQCWDGTPQRFTLPSGPGQAQSAEAESIWGTSSGGSVSVQTNCCGVSWSNGAQLWLTNAAVNSYVTLNYYVANAGTYTVIPTMTKAVDYGQVTLLVDNQPLPNVFDGYHNGVVTQAYNYGSVNLIAGNHAFTFKVTGTNPASIGNRYLVGIDTLRLEPTTNTAPTAALKVVATSQYAPSQITADASGSVAGGAPIASYTFDFGDGTIVGPQPGPQTSHVSNAPAGTYLVSVTVTDANGAISAASAPVTILPPSTLAFVQQASAQTSSQTSLATTLPSAATQNNRLVVLVGVWNTNAATAASVTDNAGDTFTKLTSSTASDLTELSVWTAVVTTGATTPTVTATASSAADIGVAVTEYAGLSTATGTAVVDQLATGTGTTGSSAGTASSAQTGPATADGELALGFYVDSGFGAQLTGNPGYTTRTNLSPNTNMDLLIEDTPVNTGGTPAASVTTGASTVWLAATIVFKHA